MQITRPQLSASAASSQQGTVPGYPAQPDITPFAPVAPLSAKILRLFADFYYNKPRPPAHFFIRKSAVQALLPLLFPKIFAAQICLGPLRHRRLLSVQITRPQLPAGAASSQQGTVPGYPAQPDITPFAPVAPLPKNLCCANLFGTPTTSAAPLRADNSPAAVRRRRRCRRPCYGAAWRRCRARSAPLKTPARSLRPQHAESAL